MLWLALLACNPAPEAQLGAFAVAVDRDAGTFSVTHAVLGPVLEDARIAPGTGEVEWEMRFGSFRFDADTDLEVPAALTSPDGRLDIAVIEARDAGGGRLGELVLSAASDEALVIDWAAADATATRASLSARCDADDHFLGLGGHAMDVDHVGERFALWTSEPGIGKVEDESYPDDWYLTGTRHATSYPVPFLLRPHRGQGLLVDTSARVEVDLCATDPERFSATAWGGRARFVVFAAPRALDTVEALTAWTGRPQLPQPWVFAPWNDAVRGPERVLEVATLLREAGAPSSVIWTEDWKGAEETSVGYHLDGEWFLDEEQYPDAEELAEELEDQGYKWFAYFSPFVRSDTETWDLAVEDGVLILDEDGAPYRFTGVTFTDESLVDLSTGHGRAWAQEWFRQALGHGFDGWMVDYAEWLPPDAVLASGEDAWKVHNVYPELWQRTNAEVLSEHDASFFVRSGWSRTGGIAPVVWAGDQRTSFDADDGFPTVVAMGLGLSASGVPVYTHDVAGYQSVGNPPSDKELWFRWAALGAFTPVLRTHHGAFDDENWQLDSDEETTAFWARLAREHTRLFPYRYGLAARASDEGTPMILPTSFLFEGEDWGRKDAWMLGEALLVAPVLERGATSREVALPAGPQWYDWATHERVQSGVFDAPLDHIPVFAASGTTVPMFETAPDTLIEGAGPGVTDLSDVDGARVVYLFGGGGDFAEADGTTYRPSGTPTGSGEVTETLTAGTVEVAGISVEIDGPVERAYRVVVVD